MTEEKDSIDLPNNLPPGNLGSPGGTPGVNHMATRDQWNAWLQTIDEAQKSATSDLETVREKTKSVIELSESATAAANKAAEARDGADAQLKSIQSTKTESETLRTELANVVAAAKTEAGSIETQKTRAQTASDDAVRLAAEMATAKNTADTSSASIAEALKASQQSAKDTKGLADKAASIEKKLNDYEERLKGLIEQSEHQLQTITGLLPGATSAGLAHAFDARAGTFNKPQWSWQVIFICSLLCLIAIGATGLWHALTTHTVLTYDELVRLWLARLPVAGALLWLTLHAGRESALAKRLEEDYSYKSAVASSFEGFRQQMRDIGASAGEGSPLAKLCEDTLNIISNPPGRIYDKHKLTVSPSQELTKIATSVAEAIKQALSAGKS